MKGIIFDLEGVNKSKPYIYLHAAKLLGFAPQECVAFEDSSPELTAAVRAGLITFAVPNHYTKKQDFSEAEFVISSSTELDLEDFLQKVTKI